ncbi:MAG: hypothetical protein WDO24_13255 [Pseudomonadota bacterium]
MTDHRLLQANMVGPAGLISMEDGEAIEISYRAALAAGDACSVVEMGGRGPIRSLDHRINDVPVARLLVLLVRADGARAGRGRAMTPRQEQATELLFEYVARIDQDRLEEWLDLFVETARYQIVPRENVEQGLPVSLMLCTNKNMLRDRIVSLREANGV